MWSTRATSDARRVQRRIRNSDFKKTVRDGSHRRTHSDNGRDDYMEHETLFTASKWHILKQLESQPRSPLELARICDTSVANVSQQLRLLEMAGLVTSRRICNRDKDKPRILYSLAGDLSYMISTSGSFVDKKMLHLSDYNKIIMRIWFFDNATLHYALEKAFWKIEENMDKISFLAFDNERVAPITFYYQASGKKLELRPFTVTGHDGVTHQIVFDDQIPSVQHMHVIYDPKGVALKKSDAVDIPKKNRGGGK